LLTLLRQGGATVGEQTSPAVLHAPGRKQSLFVAHGVEIDPLAPIDAGIEPSGHELPLKVMVLVAKSW
jgi:hypothetical protein